MRSRERREAIQSCARSLAMLDRKHAHELEIRRSLKGYTPTLPESNTITRKRANVYEERLLLADAEDALRVSHECVHHDGPDLPDDLPADRVRLQKAAVVSAEDALARAKGYTTF